MTGEGAALAWTCELPERGCRAPGQVGPRATLVIRPSTPEEERLSVPLAVGRVLCARGSELAPASRAELLYHVRSIAERCALERIAALVERRDYAVREAEGRLCRDGYGTAAREAAVARARACGLLDDARFSAAYVRSKLSAGWGERRIALELSRRGIELDDVPGWPDEFLDRDGEPARAYALLERRRVPERNAYGKLMRFLLARGFPAGVAREAVERRLADLGGADQP